MMSRSLELLRSAGFRRINLDLIYAIPGQTLPRWLKSLESAIALGTDHLSCYGLTFEPNTPLGVRRRLGLVSAIDPDLEIEMLQNTRSRLAAAGLQAYEISNYSRPGQECRHNLHYWMGGDYLALGPSGASHVQGTRWRNRPHLGEWETAVDAEQLPATDIETLTPRQRRGAGDADAAFVKRYRLRGLCRACGPCGACSLPRRSIGLPPWAL